MSEDSRPTQSLIYHPYNILLTLTLGAVVALFIALTGSYIYSRIQNPSPPIQLPGLFYINTLILLASSATMIWAKKSYRRDQTSKYQLALLVTIILSAVFMISQYVAWKELFSNEIFISYSNLASYFYLISAVHFMHVMAGVPFLILFLRSAYLQMKEPVSVLVYFSDPEKRLKLRLLTIYWHFLDALWIYLVVFFWINNLIK
ncbi:MAG: cytochrome c oxidase subunit 3 [Bacteroidia bacterium]|nr:cytochrome c oxidase subunit 3 [Bacteroidia bacterium]